MWVSIPVGPTGARTNFAGEDIVICTLEQSFKEVIERVLRRRVRSFISGLDVHCDVSAEVFYLAERL